ncbi:serine/threonine protein kinase [Pseudomonas syringae pv. syringae]|uniref:serine/threonine-protein kinase n=1 Tax=Pseudomonas syringae TaxID=317 RepID=UPI001F0E399B|nr:serine/threonine-protein kinase [Pseudomonas syringae]MCH5535207.1 serine/threonine protein kinase [Pseudomonas syringae pv. syringae]
MDGYHGNYKYRVIESIGKGGFGFVEKIELFNIADHRCGEYARKSLSDLDQELRDEFRRRFAREVSYQASCVHTNVANIYLCDLKSEQPWFIMDLAAGDLQKDIDTGALTAPQKIEVLLMVADGLIYLHSLDYLHRDIKPSNILRFTNDIYKVSDFGLVKNLDKSSESEVITKIATAMGTAKYMAPEIAIAGEYSKRTDIFALGVLLEDLDMLDNPDIHEVFKKCTARRPFDRYAEVKDMRDDFLAAVLGESK